MKLKSQDVSIAEVDAFVRDLCGEQLRVYERDYAGLCQQHPVFKSGWGRPVMHSHRFLNLIAAIQFGGSCKGTWVDIGAYDGALVMILRAMGITAYGIETVPWADMWKVTGVVDYMNAPLAKGIYVISMLNYAHAFEPRELLRRIFAQYSEPEILLIDREERTPHANNKLWYDEAVLVALGFDEVIAFPKLAKQNVDYGRELLVRRK